MSNELVPSMCSSIIIYPRDLQQGSLLTRPDERSRWTAVTEVSSCICHASPSLMAELFYLESALLKPFAPQKD